MFYPRLIYKKITNHLKKPEVTVMTGMRRTGKTTLMLRLFNDVPSKNKVFIDLENRINREIFKENDYDDIWNNLRKKFNLLNSTRSYVFLDEIQYLRELPSIIKFLFDHYKIKFVVTGSSSFYLKNLFNESLSGRKQIFELFPLTFNEFLLFKGKTNSLGEVDSIKSIKKSNWQQKEFRHLYEEYLLHGGFPGVVLAKTVNDKENMLKDILYSYIDKDVKNISTFNKINELEKLIKLLTIRIGQKTDVSKISREISLSRKTINEYLAFLEKTYFISLIRPFSKNPDREVSKMPKLYFCDTGLANMLSALSSGQILENAIFNNLKTKYPENSLKYYQRKNKTEIDFIINEETAVEVKETATSFDLKTLKRTACSIGIDNCVIISKNSTTEPNSVYAVQI